VPKCVQINSTNEITEIYDAITYIIKEYSLIISHNLINILTDNKHYVN